MQTSTSATCHSQIAHQSNPLAERNTRRALILTSIMMVVEIIGGWYFNSMALLADGWHMSSHTLALGLALFAYILARRYATDGRFAFGTWKIEILGGYTSALLLVLIAALMLFESTVRLFDPRDIHYNQAIVIAVVGLVVNLVCAWWLHDSHNHNHDHDHDHDHHDDHNHSHDHHSHKDLNLRAAYVHVLTDALTSVLAIVALCGGKLWGAVWLDPVMGIVGGILVAIWAIGLLRTTSNILLDAEMDSPLVEKIRQQIHNTDPQATISDLHLWRIGRNQYACVIALHTQIQHTALFKQTLENQRELTHISIEFLH